MAKNPPYIPTKDALLYTWAENFSNLLTAAPATYGLTAPDAVNVSNVVTPFLAAYTTAVTPATKTSVTVAAKDQAKADMLAVVRPYATEISRNEAVTSGNKTAIGVTVASTTRTPTTAPTYGPVISLEGQIPNVATIRYGDPTTPNSKAVPYGCAGVEYVGTYGTAPATDPTAANRIGRFTKSPTKVSTLGHTGKVLTVWARYETRSGVSGEALFSPYSAPISFVCV